MLEVTRFITNNKSSISPCPSAQQTKMVKTYCGETATDIERQSERRRRRKISNGRKLELSNPLTRELFVCAARFRVDCFKSKYLIIFSHLFVFMIVAQKRDETL